ncbi:MAG: hypothetical protein AAGG72_00055 [Pseudomonadota bacterium]
MVDQTKRSLTPQEMASLHKIVHATGGHDFSIVLWMFANVLVSGCVKAGIPITDVLIGQLASSMADQMHELGDQLRSGKVSVYEVPHGETLQ